MKTLHIFRTEPDETVKELASLTDPGQEDPRIALYEPDVDWDSLVDDIFAADKIISWW